MKNRKPNFKFVWTGREAKFSIRADNLTQAWVKLAKILGLTKPITARFINRKAPCLSIEEI